MDRSGHKKSGLTLSFARNLTRLFVELNDLKESKTWSGAIDSIFINYGKAWEESLCGGSRISKRYES